MCLSHYAFRNQKGIHLAILVNEAIGENMYLAHYGIHLAILVNKTIGENIWLSHYQCLDASQFGLCEKMLRRPFYLHAGQWYVWRKKG